MNMLEPGMEFTDGQFNYIVLKHDTVDWVMVMYGGKDDPCCHSNDPCNGEPVWLVLDAEGVTYNLCDEATPDSDFFASGGDPFMTEVDPDLPNIVKINRWRNAIDGVGLPIDSAKRVLDPQDVGL